MLLHRCSLCPPTWQEGSCTSLVLHPATQARSALLVLWRVHLCITSIWTSQVRLHKHSTRPCLALPQVRRSTRGEFAVFGYCITLFCHETLDVIFIQVCSCVDRLFFLCSDPNMVNAYMYQPAGTNGQPAPPPGQAPPTTSPPYSNYQPTPTQGYQVWLSPSFSFWSVHTVIMFKYEELSH